MVSPLALLIKKSLVWTDTGTSKLNNPNTTVSIMYILVQNFSNTIMFTWILGEINNIFLVKSIMTQNPMLLA